MTEAEWRTCTDLKVMVASLGPEIGYRKLRLFCCGYCRCQWRAHPEAGRRVFDAAERYAEGAAEWDELIALQHQLIQEYGERCRDVKAWTGLWAAYSLTTAQSTPGDAFWTDMILGPIYTLQHLGCQEAQSDMALLAALLRDVVGNPSRPVTVDPTWLTWKANTAYRLARAIYADRAFDRLPVLADALEEAGCTDAALLDHCRRPGEHVRGCWVVDLLLGKA